MDQKSDNSTTIYIHTPTNTQTCLSKNESVSFIKTKQTRTHNIYVSSNVDSLEASKFLYV